LKIHIDESLERLKTDYLDIFLFHGGSAIRSESFHDPGGLLETAEKAREAGKIRYLGFSAHSEELACKALDVDLFDFAMVPANFISTKYIDGEFMEKARDRGVTVIAMKPFGGGRIENPDLCLRFLKQYPDILPCVGVDRIDHMAENLRFWEGPAELNANDMEEIEGIREELGDHFCRQCGYCHPCPEDVPIIMMNLMEAWVKQFSPEALSSKFGGGVEKARGCIECRECVEKCPYDLPIPEMIKDGIALFERATAL
jgi:predicted aldo/keto reductase-like oxidoreductase